MYYWENKMSQYYEPQNQPVEQGLTDSKRPFWAVEDFLESVDVELNMNDEAIWRLSDFNSRAVPPAIIDPRVIVVDGPIGAGKSTFCKHLKKYLIDHGFEATIIEEAVADKSFGQNGGITLEEYYKNPKELAFQFQEQVVHALGKQLLHCRFAEEYHQYDFIIFDRWLPSASAFILFKMRDGYITKVQGQYLHYLIDHYMLRAGILPAFHIRFAIDPSICEDHIKDRASDDSHRLCELEALDTIRQTNDFLLEHRGVYNPLVAIEPGNVRTIWSGSQYCLIKAAAVTRQFVITDAWFEDNELHDRRYNFTIGDMQISSEIFFERLSAWARKKLFRAEPLSFENFERVLTN